ncbi:MAG: hypothetical protein M1281_02335 [Chloroflexi bacterium]|nr:hypothetical protein [Chloroflexota bacterium]
MLSESDLRELLDFSAPDPVVSLYLSTDPTDGNTDVHRLRLRNMLKEVNLEQDQQAIERYFEHERDWYGRGVVIFSCAPQGFFRAFPLAVPVKDRVRIDIRPTVKPLVDLLDAYGGYGVALVDKQGARLFYIHMGELAEQEGVLGEVVKHTKRGGASAFPGRRGGIAGQTHYQDELVERNMRDVIEFATRFWEEKRVRRVLIGGTDDNVSLFRSLLPKAWQSLVVGVFPMSMTASTADVLEKATQVGLDAEQKREKRLIDALTTAAAKGNGGVMGLENTLKALHDGRIQTLLITEGFRASGYRCETCGYMVTEETEACPFCGGTFTKIVDAAEMAVREVLQEGGEVEIIHSTPGLEDSGKIGALLRY